MYDATSHDTQLRTKNYTSRRVKSANERTSQRREHIFYGCIFAFFIFVLGLVWNCFFLSKMKPDYIEAILRQLENGEISEDESSDNEDDIDYCSN